ncbi:hypothetical protein T492DRAFT_904951 [Pavlovales sp. CCMP2436]|nr:hypothetical protein T492DRAFT_904951 [Pavlovales sp. CCMP2436]
MGNAYRGALHTAAPSSTTLGCSKRLKVPLIRHLCPPKATAWGYQELTPMAQAWDVKRFSWCAADRKRISD